MTAKLVKYMRKIARLQQNELGERVGVHGSTISDYERGKSKPSVEMLIRIANACDYTIYLKDRHSDEIIDLIQRLDQSDE